MERSRGVVGGHPVALVQPVLGLAPLPEQGPGPVGCDVQWGRKLRPGGAQGQGLARGRRAVRSVLTAQAGRRWIAAGSVDGRLGEACVARHEAPAGAPLGSLLIRGVVYRGPNPGNPALRGLWVRR